MPKAARFVKLTVDGPRRSWMPLTRSRGRPAVNGPSFAGTSLGSHMIVSPTPVGLILCDYVLVEQGTKKVSLIGSFREVGVEQFPAILPPFYAYAALTDGLGSGTLELVLSRLETDEDVFSHRSPVSF